jgi:hypothetical protein
MLLVAYNKDAFNAFAYQRDIKWKNKPHLQKFIVNIRKVVLKYSKHSRTNVGGSLWLDIYYSHKISKFSSFKTHGSMGFKSNS